MGPSKLMMVDYMGFFVPKILESIVVHELGIPINPYKAPRNPRIDQCLKYKNRLGFMNVHHPNLWEIIGVHPSPHECSRLEHLFHVILVCE